VDPSTPLSARDWQRRGVEHARAGALDEALACFEQAAALDGASALHRYNLGLALRRLGHLERAAAAYRAALERDPSLVEAHNNLGNVLLAQGREEEALECFRALVRRFPDCGDGHYNLANVLADTGRIDEAATHYRRALELEPEKDVAWENLGRMLVAEGRSQQAAEVWRAWHERQPHHPIPRHMLAALTGEGTPARCDDDYVRASFDAGFAESFDLQLGRLGYRPPELLGEALHELCGARTDLVILDGGCGTGLCGTLLRAAARRLVGVDLSPDMLARARARGVYDETVAEELTRYLESHPRAFDGIALADTLCYFGDLEAVLGAALHSLRPGGWLLFTVEARDAPRADPPWTLGAHGRYAHHEDYVRDVLHTGGFSAPRVTRAVLRQERGRGVEGLVVRAFRGSS
jgi:predicted TPR repeat methyltransferase